MTSEDWRQGFRELHERVERVEKLLGIDNWRPTPGFDPQKFQRILLSYLAWPLALLGVPFVGSLLLINVVVGQASADKLFGLPLWNVGGDPTVAGVTLGIVAIGGGAVGVVSIGGFAIGALAFGGGAIGLVAAGGGALGVVAIGGGSYGLIAVGGGATGYIAVGGGAFGTYVLAGDGRGRYVFDRRSQDDEAVRLFCKYLPRLRKAFAEESPYRTAEEQ